MKLVECVPNFSEGRDQEKINTITKEIESTSQVTLLDVDPGESTNRTVVTFIGSPEGVKEAAFKAIKKAAEVLDMSKQNRSNRCLSFCSCFRSYNGRLYPACPRSRRKSR